MINLCAPMNIIPKPYAIGAENDLGSLRPHSQNMTTRDHHDAESELPLSIGPCKQLKRRYGYIMRGSALTWQIRTFLALKPGNISIRKLRYRLGTG